MNVLSAAETGSIFQYVVSSNLLQQYEIWDVIPSGKLLLGRQCFLLDTDTQQRILTHDVVGELCLVAGK